MAKNKFKTILSDLSSKKRSNLRLFVVILVLLILGISGYNMAIKNGHILSANASAVVGGGVVAIISSGANSNNLTINDGAWVLHSNGTVDNLGTAPNTGNLSSVLPAGWSMVGGTATPDHKGWYAVSNTGAVYNGGSAQYKGGMNNGTNGQVIKYNGRIVGIYPTSNSGYYILASDGGVFSFGDAVFHNSMGGQKLNAPIVNMAVTSDGGGYWEVASDGGVFAFGNAQFKGSMGGQKLNQPMAGIVATSNTGYFTYAKDGGVFSYGDSTYNGSLPGNGLSVNDVVSASATNGGYFIAESNGNVYGFGNAYLTRQAIVPPPAGTPAPTPCPSGYSGPGNGNCTQNITPCPSGSVGPGNGVCYPASVPTQPPTGAIPTFTGSWTNMLGDEFNDKLLGCGSTASSSQDNLFCSIDGLLSNLKLWTTDSIPLDFSSSNVNTLNGNLILTPTTLCTTGPPCSYKSAGVTTSPKLNKTGFTFTPNDSTTYDFEIDASLSKAIGNGTYIGFNAATEIGGANQPTTIRSQKDFILGINSSNFGPEFTVKDSYDIANAKLPIQYTTPISTLTGFTNGFDATTLHRYSVVVFSDSSWSLYIDGNLQTWVGSNGIAPGPSSNSVYSPANALMCSQPDGFCTDEKLHLNIFASVNDVGLGQQIAPSISVERVAVYGYNGDIRTNTKISAIKLKSHVVNGGGTANGTNTIVTCNVPSLGITGTSADGNKRADVWAYRTTNGTNTQVYARAYNLDPNLSGNLLGIVHVGSATANSQLLLNISQWNPNAIGLSDSNNSTTYGTVVTAQKNFVSFAIGSAPSRLNQPLSLLTLKKGKTIQDVNKLPDCTNQLPNYTK